MNLEDIKSNGCFTAPDMEKVEGSWTPAGKKRPTAFSVWVIKELSCDAFERITLAHTNREESRIARIISDAVRFGDEGEERMTYEAAKRLKTDFALALKACYDKVHGGKAEPDADTKTEEETPEGKD